MKKYITFLSSILSFLCLLNSNVDAQTAGIIRGRIVDLNTKEALAFVNISLTDSSDLKVPFFAQTDLNGHFLIKDLRLTSYSIRISYLGYQSLVMTGLSLSPEKPAIDLADVSLSADSKMLSEVVIEYQRPVVEMLDDKLVFNVAQGLFSEGSVASDILKNVPMVSVDIDGKATIAGRRNTRVFIDGKPSDFNSGTIGELLSVLPSDALETIEVITDPSSKFDADGDGIINLIMKKGKKVGLSGNVSTTAGTLGNYNAAAFLSSGKKESFMFNASAGYNHSVRQSDASSTRRNILTDTTFYNNQTNWAERMSNGMNGRFSGTYKPDSLQVLKFSLRGGFNRGKSISVSENLYLDEDLAEKRLRAQNNNAGNKNHDYVFDADYDLSGRHKDHYSFGINFNRNAQTDDRDYSRYVFSPVGSMTGDGPDMQWNNNSNVGTNLQLSADVDRSFDFLKLRLEAGTKFNLNSSDNQQLAQDYDYLNQEYIINPVLTNDFDFRQQIYAGYVTARWAINKWSFRLGTRGEVTGMAFRQQNEDDIDFKPYINLFPSLALTRTFKAKYRIGVNYSRRVSRPRYNLLNPIIDDSDPQNIRFGNINLKPSLTDQYELSFTMFGKGWSVSPRISYAESYKIIERVKTVINGSGDTETTWQNVGSSNSLNFSTYANYQVDKTKSLNGGLTLSRVNYQSTTNSNLNPDRLAVRANMGSSYSFNKSTAIEINLNYIRNAAVQGSVNGSVQTQVAMKKNFLSNKMSVRLTVVDPFSQRNTNSITEGPNFYQESFSVQKTRNIMAGLSYRFTRVANSAK